MSRTNQSVMADGCFDPLHIGHIRYLAVASDMADELIVNVASDDTITRKGRKPYQTLEERMKTIEAIDGVDLVVAHDLATAIDLYVPLYLVKGVEWAGRLPYNVVNACRKVGTTIVYTNTQERTSSQRLA